MSETTYVFGADGHVWLRVGTDDVTALQWHKVEPGDKEAKELGGRRAFQYRIDIDGVTVFRGKTRVGVVDGNMTIKATPAAGKTLDDAAKALARTTAESRRLGRNR